MSGSNNRAGGRTVLGLVGAGMIVASLGGGALAGGGKLPDGFVYLKELAPGIRQDMRYAGADNFTGAVVPGYAAGACILARPVAAGLAKVQADLARDGFGLKVFDCYRPVRAVQGFMKWADGKAGPGDKSYFPRVARGRIIELGYVARRSSHSLGTAVDLTLVWLGKGDDDGAKGAAKREDKGAGEGRSEGEARPVTCLAAARFNRSDDEVDMGTAFDCFDANSHTASQAVGAAQREARQRLVKAMSARGFRNYAKEWWHFSMPLAAFKTAQDFPVR